MGHLDRFYLSEGQTNHEEQSIKTSVLRKSLREANSGKMLWPCVKQQNACAYARPGAHAAGGELVERKMEEFRGRKCPVHPGLSWLQ